MESKPMLAPGLVATLKNEKGISMVLVIVMVLLLSILSTTMLGTSNSELSIAGNFRNSEAAFYAAESGITIGTTYDAIYTALYGTTTSWPIAGQGTVLDANTLAATSTNSPDRNYNRINIPAVVVGGTVVAPAMSADVKVELLGSGKLPSGTGTQEDSGLSPGTGFKASNYAVTVIGNGPNNSKATIETQIARIIQQ